MKLPFKLPHKIEERNRLVGFMIGMGMAVVFSILYIAGPLKVFTDWDLDAKFNIRNNWLNSIHDAEKKFEILPVNEDMVFIEIDDSTLDWEGTFPDDPVYYIDLIDKMGREQFNALAMMFSIDYSHEFGRKVDPDNSMYFQDVFGKIAWMLGYNASKKSDMVDQLSYLREFLDDPGAGASKSEIAARIEELVFSDTFQEIDSYMNMVSAFSQQNAELNELAPDREKMLANHMEGAGNVFFMYKSENMAVVPYDVDDLRNNAGIREMLLNVLRRPTLNRPENEKLAQVYEAYFNLLPDELKLLIEEKNNPFPKDVIERLKSDYKKRQAELEEFRLQNKYVEVDIPPGVEDNYLHLRKAVPVNPTIGRKTVGQGMFKAEISSDGKLRRIAPVAIYAGKMYPHVDFLLALQYLNVPLSNITFEKRRIILKDAVNPRTGEKKDIVIPLLEDGTMIVNWAGLWADTSIPFGHKSLKNIYMNIGRLNNYKAHQDILSLPKEEREAKLAELPAEVIELRESITADEAQTRKAELENLTGKILIVGRTAVGTEDLNPTPLEPRYPLLGLHANVINTIVQDIFIKYVKWYVVIVIFFVLSLSVGMVGGVVQNKSTVVTGLINFLFMGFVISVYGAFAFYMFVFRYTSLPILAAVLLVVLTFLLVFIYRFVTEEQEKKKMKNMFGTYVNKEVVESLIEDPDKLKLGGEWMECTVFFSDVAGFTSISESMPPEDLDELLNEYLTAMTDIIFEYGGTLDKYIGDAVVAIFGAPIPFPENDHAIRACLATIDMQEKLEQMRQVWREQGKTELTARCGVNTGMMIAGNMGSVKRFNYTVVGENVEYGEHLESGGKKWGTVMTISEPTYNYAKDVIHTRLLDVDWLESKPVRILEIMGRKEEPLADNIKKGIAVYEEGVQLYFAREFDKAIAKFKEVFEHIPEDLPSQRAIGRCEDAKENPPDEEFDKRAAHIGAIKV